MGKGRDLDKGMRRELHTDKWKETDKKDMEEVGSWIQEDNWSSKRENLLGSESSLLLLKFAKLLINFSQIIS